MKAKNKIFNWDKPKVHQYRYIKGGDLFCYRIAEKLFGYGRIIAKNKWGAYALFFDKFTSRPPENLQTEDIDALKAGPVLFGCILDCYTLLVSKLHSDWRIIAQDPDIAFFDFNEITSINPLMEIGHNADFSITVPIKNQEAVQRIRENRCLDEKPNSHYHILGFLIAKKPELFNKENAPYIGFDEFIDKKFYEIHGEKLDLSSRNC
ncbi:Uncharacterised protein [Kingella potus]|uniref:Uncharacterized protein n=1 Tax=Kingella potus TaxID=265175 RepID=A0A377R160_9NEIS|nr:hypothetical protein [Kingella potus]UOP01049.1 immunity 26/phosphotriesterase HocA family protein [Kingella potus]STR00730.1 Uncharacterised protein [Kingella potus]